MKLIEIQRIQVKKPVIIRKSKIWNRCLRMRINVFSK